MSTFCDLGVTYTSKFSFNTHINIIINKSFKMLGFLKRNSTHFNNLKTFLTLYNHLIRSNLEYCAIVWSPTTACCINDIERVQRKFIKFLRYKFHLSYSHEQYLNYLDCYLLIPLYSRRLIFQIKFVHKLFTGSLEFPHLLSLIKLNIPIYNTRKPLLYSIPSSNTDILSKHPIYSVLNFFNKHFIKLSDPIELILVKSKPIIHINLIKILT